MRKDRKLIQQKIVQDKLIKHIIPSVEDPLDVSDIAGIDETCPVYTGLDRTDNIWIGKQSSYTNITESSDSLLRLNEQRIEIITLDDDDNADIGYDYFNAFRFKRALSNGILHFGYRKVNGQAREAYGTTNPQILRENGQKFVFNRQKQLGPNIRYYDMYCKGWRSFKPDRLVRIYEEERFSEYK